MTINEKYIIVLFRSVHHVLKAEKILKKEGVPHKIIPVPKSISSECGVCVRLKPEHAPEIGHLRESLSGIEDIREL